MNPLEHPDVPLLIGPLAADAAWPLNLRAILCDPGPYFCAQCCDAPGQRRASRNGRVLWCGDRGPEELAGQPVGLRLQAWHPPASPVGVLLYVRALDPAGAGGDLLATRLVSAAAFRGELGLDLGDDLVLEFSNAVER